MENKDTVIRLIIGTALIIVLTIVAMRKPHDMIAPQAHNVCKEDSLTKVINELEIDFVRESDGWDNKENRYESILFEYEYGIEHLKQTHPDAYREFHRIIGYKENYSHECERENKKRLKAYEQYR
jgi:hypothetical protein